MLMGISPGRWWQATGEISNGLTTSHSDFRIQHRMLDEFVSIIRGFRNKGGGQRDNTLLSPATRLVDEGVGPECAAGIARHGG